jgi:cellulose biosynthesis protein BcsQ
VKVVATYNIKGGVGKTATAVNLAYLAAQGGARTLIWDLDPQGATSFYLRVKPRVKGGVEKLLRRRRALVNEIKSTDFRDLDVLPADFSHRNLDLVVDALKKPRQRLARLLAPLAQHYDYAFLDCAPGVSVFSESVFRASDALLVPLIPTTLSLRTYEQLRRHLGHSGSTAPAVLPFFSMVDRRKRLHREVVDGWPAAHRELLASAVPYSSDVERMGLERAPVCAFAGGSRAAKSYAALWQELAPRL